MVNKKHVPAIIMSLMAVAVVLCLLAIAFSEKLTGLLGGTGVSMEYESKLFNTDEIITINIEIDEDDWNDMLQNAISEEYYVCDVTINGLKINDVAIRPKGNTSLSSIAMDPDTDRYSLKLEFGHYVEGQTCYGLDKLILNNNYADATNMKEALIYDMFQFIGADASLYNYASVSVNGEYWGVYLALEGVEQSFMLRNYGSQDGELYKPDSMEMGGGDDDSSSGSFGPGSFGPGNDSDTAEGSRPSFGGPGSDSDTAEGSRPSFGGPGGQGGERPSFEGSEMPDGEMPSFEGFEAPDGEMPSSEDFDPSEMKGFSPGGMSGFGFGSGGANLNYSDDELDSYQTIWDGEITESGDADHKRVIKALKNISEGNDIETYMDVDNILKYMAVHTFAVNMDSLSGSMAHNYYLYEYDGQLNIIPWDYNLSFGGMNAGKDSDATDIINDAIDTPFSMTNFFDSLLENEEYLAKYHEYLQQLVDEYVDGGRFDEVYSRITEQIDELVAADPTAFYSYEEYQNASSILYETIKLRAESIKGQLDGTIPSTDSGQREDSSSLIDASHIDITAMGQMNMGGSGERDSDGNESSNDPTGTDENGDIQDSSEDSSNNDKGGHKGFGPGNMPGGGDFGGGNMPDMGSFDGEGMPEMGSFDPSNMPEGLGSSNATAKLKTLAGYGACLAAMIAAFFIVKAHKRRRTYKKK